MPEPAVWTIGHSTRSFAQLATLLRSERIAHVVDVRSYPYSRFAPHFNREPLAGELARNGFGYLFLGAALGGRPDSPDHYDSEGRARYAPMADQLAFREALLRLRQGAGRHRIALMCSEADPTHCHRRLLVGRVLTQHGVELRHILGSGSVSRRARLSASSPGQRTRTWSGCSTCG
jgi:uncharacterized protein (DUF488 family)